jgi:hypothetical protein
MRMNFRNRIHEKARQGSNGQSRDDQRKKRERLSPITHVMGYLFRDITKWLEDLLVDFFRAPHGRELLADRVSGRQH